MALSNLALKKHNRPHLLPLTNNLDINFLNRKLRRFGTKLLVPITNLKCLWNEIFKLEIITSK